MSFGVSQAESIIDRQPLTDRLGRHTHGQRSGAVRCTEHLSREPGEVAAKRRVGTPVIVVAGASIASNQEFNTDYAD